MRPSLPTVDWPGDAPKFAKRNDPRFVQQTVALEVGDQRRHGAIELFRDREMTACWVVNVFVVTLELEIYDHECGSQEAHNDS